MLLLLLSAVCHPPFVPVSAVSVCPFEFCLSFIILEGLPPPRLPATPAWKVRSAVTGPPACQPSRRRCQSPGPPPSSPVTLPACHQGAGRRLPAQPVTARCTVTGRHCRSLAIGLFSASLPPVTVTATASSPQCQPARLPLSRHCHHNASLPHCHCHCLSLPPAASCLGLSLLPPPHLPVACQSLPPSPSFTEEEEEEGCLPGPATVLPPPSA